MSWRIQVQGRIGALGLDVCIEHDETPLALIGPNGSGKTTLLRIIAGALRPDGGEIEVAGALLFSSTQDRDVPSEARRVGYVPQGSGLFPHLRVIDNVAFGLSTGPRRLTGAARRKVAMRALEDLGCAHLANRAPVRLSGGERQRIALARALVIEPGMLLLDEPLASLDATSRRDLRRFLAARLRAAGVPSIVVTHDLRDVVALGATVCALEEGRVVQRGRVESLCAAPATDFIAEFVGAGIPQLSPVPR